MSVNKDQLAAMEENISTPMTMRSKDPDWVDGFKEYNDDVKRFKKLNKTVPYLGGQPLHMTCNPCYAVVLRYLKAKHKK